MRRSRSTAILPLSSALVTWFTLCGPAVATPTIWSGLTKPFTKDTGADDTLSQNQDPLTADIVLTRGPSGGLINFATESFYDSFTSPAGTEWATDLNNPSQSIAATNWQSLSFTNWIAAYGGSGTAGSMIAGRDAVVHLISDDVYLDLQFTSWIAGHAGAYSYLRAEPALTPPPTGDYNVNNVVDAADYVVWRDTLGNFVSLGRGADGDKSGKIDAGDYDFWRERFGNPAPASAAGINSVARLSVAIPEPATDCLLLLALFGFQWWWGGRRSAMQLPSRDLK